MNEPEVQCIEIPIITLVWSGWYTWDSVKRDARSDPESVAVPNASGVYEARYSDEEERLTIGKASNLRMRIRQGLVKEGNVPHSSGDRIRQEEDTSRIVIRWAATDRPSAVEEELHRQYVAHFGHLPKHTKRT